MNEFVRIDAALTAAVERLRDVSDSPRLDAELLLARALDVRRSYLFAHPDDALDPAAVERFEHALANRQDGIPLAYITGEKEFWSMSLMVSPDTLVPRPETEVLVEQALMRIPEADSCRILDLGTGSGAIGLAIAKERPNCDVVATDSCEPALAIARENARQLDLPNIEFRHGDWAAPVAGEVFDIVLSNPPYVPDNDPALATLQREPRNALAAGADGLDAIRQISASAPGITAAGGCILLEHGDGQKAMVQQILTGDGWRDIRTVNDLAGKPRVTIARLKREPD